MLVAPFIAGTVALWVWMVRRKKRAAAAELQRQQEEWQRQQAWQAAEQQRQQYEAAEQQRQWQAEQERQRHAQLAEQERQHQLREAQAAEHNRQAEAARTERWASLVARYGQGDAEKVWSQKLWIGAPLDAVVDMFGPPLDVDEKVLKTKTTRTYKYKSTGKNRYALRVYIENDAVTGWEDKSD
jgi:hypothetical protein